MLHRISYNDGGKLLITKKTRMNTMSSKAVVFLQLPLSTTQHAKKQNNKMLFRVVLSNMNY